VQPGATRFFDGKGATRPMNDPTLQICFFLMRFVLKNAGFAPLRSKKAALPENAREGATGGRKVVAPY
jgi:hypothetical protein